MPAWEPFAAAAFAPAAVWVLWRVQTLAVELLRWRLVKLTTVADLRWIYATVSWLGVVLHEVSHASVLLLSGHGIKQFRAGVESGHVLPARMRKGPIAFLSFLLAALAPLFVPPILVLLALRYLAGVPILAFHTPVGEGLAAALDGLQHALLVVPRNIAYGLAGLDLATWQGATVLAIALLAMPSSRPSHIKGSRFHGTKDEGDVAVLRAQIRSHPIVFLVFLALVYGAYFLASFHPPTYWYPFEAIWAVALTGTALALLGALWWSLVGLGRGTKAWAWWLGPAAFVAAQVWFHTETAWTALEVNGASVAAWAVVAVALRATLPRTRGP